MQGSGQHSLLRPLTKAHVSEIAFPRGGDVKRGGGGGPAG